MSRGSLEEGKEGILRGLVRGRMAQWFGSQTWVESTVPEGADSMAGERLKGELARKETERKLSDNKNFIVVCGTQTQH